MYSHSLVLSLNLKNSMCVCVVHVSVHASMCMGTYVFAERDSRAGVRSARVGNARARRPTLPPSHPVVMLAEAQCC